MRFDILTIFPKIFSVKGGSASGGDSSYLNYSILKRAQEKRLIKIVAHNLRDYTTDKHHKVDDKPYGGGPGMVIKIEPVYRVVQFLKAKSITAKAGSSQGGKKQKAKIRTILFSTWGKKLDAKMAKRLSKYDQLIMICGRYEGVDERVAKYIADEEISIGDYVLSGGELPAMVLTEAVARYIPGVLGKYESLEEIKGSYPVYTRPEVFKAKNITAKTGSRQGGKKHHRQSGIPPRREKSKIWKVPKVLLSGSHREIDRWRMDK